MKEKGRGKTKKTLSNQIELDNNVLKEPMHVCQVSMCFHLIRKLSSYKKMTKYITEV